MTTCALRDMIMNVIYTEHPPEYKNLLEKLSLNLYSKQSSVFKPKNTKSSL